MGVCIDEIRVEGYTVSIKLSKHAEDKLKSYRITEKVISNEFRNLSFDDFTYLKGYYGDKPFLLNNVERNIGIVFKVSGYRIFVITVILEKQLYNVKAGTSLVTIDNQGEIINIYKYREELDKEARESEELQDYMESEPLTTTLSEHFAGLL